MMSIPGIASASDFKSLVKAKAQSAAAVPETVPYSYLVTIAVDSQEGKDDSEQFTGQYRLNPAATPGERVTIIDGSWDDYPKDMRKELEEANFEYSQAQHAEDFWCVGDQEMLEMMASDAVTVLREDAREAVVSLTPDAIAYFMDDDDDGERDMPKKIRKRMLAELTFSKPSLLLTQSKIWLSKPTTVKIVAKMKEMNFEQRCSPAPNGLPYVSENNVKVSGKAMGSHFGATVNVTLSDLQPN